VNSLSGVIVDVVIFLTGFMGSGKSTVGCELARRLGRPFIDLDCLIEEREGRSISRIFAESGEKAFREAERRALSALPLEQRPVVATGGGVVLSRENREVMSRTGVRVWLKCPLAELVRRLETSADERGGRPLWTGDPEELGRLLEQRTPAYAEAADLVVDAAAAPGETVTVIAAWLEGRAAG